MKDRDKSDIELSVLNGSKFKKIIKEKKKKKMKGNKNKVNIIDS
jgi:hypothetical protein